MSDIKCHYTEKEMKVALNNIDKTDKEINKIGYEVEKKIKSKFNGVDLNNLKNVNKIIADDNGITILEFINSPNMQYMITEFQKKVLKDVVNILKDDYGFTHKEASAIIYFTSI